MLKQINISHMEQLTSQLESALADGYTHFAPYANEIKIHQDMLKSVTLHLIQSSLIIQSTENI